MTASGCLVIFKAPGRSFRLYKRVLLREEMKASKLFAIVRVGWNGLRGRLGRSHTRRSTSANSNALI